MSGDDQESAGAAAVQGQADARNGYALTGQHPNESAIAYAARQQAYNTMKQQIDYENKQKEQQQ